MQETQETRVWSLGGEDTLEEGMATHSSSLAWRIPWTEQPSRLQSIGSQSRGQLKYAHRHITSGAAQTQIPRAMCCCYIALSVGHGVLRSFPQRSGSTQLSGDASSPYHRSICLHAPDQLQRQTATAHYLGLDSQWGFSVLLIQIQSSTSTVHQGRGTERVWCPFPSHRHGSSSASC